jgi:P-type Ca2+ transporter type 2C
MAHTDTDVDRGLTEEEVVRRLGASGPNEIEERPPAPAWRRFVQQFTNTMILVLLGAAVITMIVGDLKDTMVIVTVVTLNAAIGYRQERIAEQAIAALKQMASPVARVIREGHPATIPSREVVVGDVLHLATGDIVPADARLVEAPGLRVNEAALTGESVPVDKDADPLASGGRLVGERYNMVFKGTAVTSGRASAIVTATGQRTELGTIAGLLQAHRGPETSLQRRLAILGRRIALAAVMICAVVFIVGVAGGVSPSRMLLTAVSLAVAAIPESLPAVVTISLALGAQRMARQNAIIRKLPAVETLGSVTVIATDKTGTLTQGSMFAAEIWTNDRTITVTGSGYEPAGCFSIDGEAIDPSEAPSLLRLLEAAALCNDATLIAPAGVGAEWSMLGDPTEAALLSLAGKAGLDRGDLETRTPRMAEFAFDSTRKRMSTMHGGPNAISVVSVKGAPESVLPQIKHIATPAGDVTATRARLAAQRDAATAMADRGYRVLAIAGATRTDRPSLEDLESELCLFGLVGLADPPRPEAAEAVALARGAGITPVMITGDHPSTARAIADELGIIDGRRVMTGAELVEEGSQALAQHVADVAVYARTTPEQKLDIIEAWKARGEIVAMTGDGVNDAPALKRADIGVAMGVTGTEVSKEASDMVLADDNFATIVSAVREGRRIYDNIRRFVSYGLTGGSAEIWVMLAAPLFGLPLALLPAQILWINLVTHGLPGLALGVEPAERDVMRRPPRHPAESIFARGLWQHVLVFGLVTAGISLGLGVWAHQTGRPWQTMIFTSLALLQLGNAFAVRSERESVFGLRVGNRFLFWSVLGTLIVQIGLPYIAPVRQALQIDPLTFTDLMIVLVASSGAFWAIELEKLVLRRRVGGWARRHAERSIRRAGAVPQRIRTVSRWNGPPA